MEIVIHVNKLKEGWDVTNLYTIVPLRASASDILTEQTFRRCLYEHQSFQSDEERRFAVLVDSDNEPDVLRWVKPGSKQFQIEYRRGERYEPDFVVETKAEELIVEIKARRDLEDGTVKAKAKAARTWVGHANDHAKTYGGKPWRYVLIPHDAMLENVTLAGLAAKLAQMAIIEEAVPA